MPRLPGRQPASQGRLWRLCHAAPGEADVNIVFDYKPLEVHKPFHVCLEREAVMFGGYGSGKSYALCAEAIAFMFEQPGSEILVCRKTIPSLRDTTEAIFMGLLPPAFLTQCDVRRSGGHNQEIVFPNGSTAKFRGLDDWMKLKSLNLAGIFFDEVDELDEETYVGLLSRVRQRQPTPKARGFGATAIERRIVRAASNPAGHNWVWKRFVSPEALDHCAFFTSSSLDNPYLPLDYLESMLAMPDPWVRRYVLCSFDDFAGQIYPEWTYDSHVIQPYRAGYPRGHAFWMGMDPGTADPTAAVWAVYDSSRDALVAIAEYEYASLAAVEHANAWKSLEAAKSIRPPVRRVADPTIRTRDRGTNNALSDQYLRLGLNFEEGPKVVNQRLPMLGQLIHQKRWLATEECPRLIERIAQYSWKDLTPQQRERGEEQKPNKKDAHLVDAAQYIASRYIASPKIAPVEPAHTPAEEAELDRQEWLKSIQKSIRKQITDRKNATQKHDLGSFNV